MMGQTVQCSVGCLFFPLLQVKSVLQQLTAMNPNPTIGLAEAAEMLCKHLGVALVRYTHIQPILVFSLACMSSLLHILGVQNRA